MEKKKVYYFCVAPISFGYERVEISWYHLFALPNIKIFYFRARVHHFWWLLIFDSFLTLDTGKLKRIQTSEKSFGKILLAVLPASKRPDISAPLHNSSVHFHLHNCSLKILDDGLTTNACSFPQTQTKRLIRLLLFRRGRRGRKRRGGRSQTASPKEKRWI